MTRTSLPWSEGLGKVRAQLRRQPDTCCNRGDNNQNHGDTAGKFPSIKTSQNILKLSTPSIVGGYLGANLVDGHQLRIHDRRTLGV